MKYKNKKAFVIGLAKSGIAACKLLSKNRNTVLVTDRSEQTEEVTTLLKELGVNFIVSADNTDILDDSFDFVVKNPGVHPNNPLVVKAKELNIPVINEVELAYECIPSGVKVIGVTGSNGKTTTVTLIYNMLKMANKPVHLGGNIGFPVASIVEDIKKNEILLAEISDHQLHDMYEFKCDISVLTNLSEVHLDFNGSYENYKLIKKKIFNNQSVNDLAIINGDDKDVVALTNDLVNKKLFFSTTKGKDTSDLYISDNGIYYNNELIININDIRVKGEHNYQNIMCAIAVVKEFGVTNEIIKEVLANFGGVEHRLEFVDKINNRTFYNDSKSTNNTSTIVALKSYNTPVILLLGGYDRGQSYDELNEYMTYVKLVVAYGSTSDRIKDFCERNLKNVISVETLSEAVKAAYQMSEEEDTILLSPASASQDQYKNFEERGKDFKNIVNNLNN